MEIPHITEQRAAVESNRASTGFWHRQFAATVTRPQIIFDDTFGVIGPILCFVFDPIVVNAYPATSDEKRKELLKSCYREITDENRAAIMRD